MGTRGAGAEGYCRYKQPPKEMLEGLTLQVHANQKPAQLQGLGGGLGDSGLDGVRCNGRAGEEDGGGRNEVGGGHSALNRFPIP
jgi:hypothetical protein